MKITLTKTDAGDRLLVPGDMHHDLHDQAAIEVMILVAQAERVNSVCLIGDTFESAGVSRHKSMRRASRFRDGHATIKAESEAARPNLARLKALVPDPAKRHVLTGNHCAWWSEIQAEYPGLMDTEWHELYGDIFDGWHIHSEFTALKYEALLVCHGHRLRGSLSKNSAAAVLSNYPGQNTLYGHTHRVDEATTPTFRYGRQSAYGAWTIGHLKDRDSEIIDGVMGPHSEKHQQGFGLVSFFNRGDGTPGFNVEKVRIQRDYADKPYAVVNGTLYR